MVEEIVGGITTEKYVGNGVFFLEVDGFESEIAQAISDFKKRHPNVSICGFDYTGTVGSNHDLIIVCSLNSSLENISTESWKKVNYSTKNLGGVYIIKIEGAELGGLLVARALAQFRKKHPATTGFTFRIQEFSGYMIEVVLSSH